MDDQENDALEQKVHALVLDYLSSASPEQRHIFVARSNYDDNLWALQYLIDDPQLECATTLMAFWCLGAAWYVQFEDESEVPFGQEKYRLVRLIEERYLSGFYTNQNIWYSPMHSDLCRPDDYPDVPVKRVIPERMREPVGGEIDVDMFDSDYDDGLPLELAEEIFSFYRQD